MSNATNTQHVELDLVHCNGCQGCVDLNPDIFEWDETTDRPIVIRPEATIQEVQDAMNCCPGECILIKE
ncbi:ferredoxin [Pseudodesulfovibrio senegalensis]|uniref:Ferredoxin n=1 Tax=Pseudodesulfovibrio senegalensis TaxID=1721087 RepID=A0A6N6N865_9BACT|nr:ferredoxin [Pseudodesulfovibrio senegalensis]KAB1443499.1 ferredoxin [Pseudodesulfovibrio senegalensis]